MRPIHCTIPALLFVAATSLPALAQQAQNPPPAQFQLPSNWGTSTAIAPESSSLSPALTQRSQAPLAHVSRVQPIPEPSQWALMATGMGLVVWIVRRRSKRNKD